MRRFFNPVNTSPKGQVHASRLLSHGAISTCTTCDPTRSYAEIAVYAQTRSAMLNVRLVLHPKEEEEEEEEVPFQRLGDSCTPSRFCRFVLMATNGTEE
jgi:hypothetical protein